MPEDFRRFPVEADPVGCWDDNCFEWWSIDRIKSIAAHEDCRGSTDPDIERDAARYLLFADFHGWFWAYAICCVEGENFGKVAIIGVPQDHFVANTFSEFVDLALDDSNAILV